MNMKGGKNMDKNKHLERKINLQDDKKNDWKAYFGKAGIHSLPREINGFSV